MILVGMNTPRGSLTHLMIESGGESLCGRPSGLNPRWATRVQAASGDPIEGRITAAEHADCARCLRAPVTLVHEYEGNTFEATLPAAEAVTRSAELLAEGIEPVVA